MDTREFYDRLDISGPQEFAYYDNYAALMESEEEFSYELLYGLFDNVNEDELIKLTEGYFAELLEDVPEEQEDFYILIENIGRCLAGILKSREDDRIAKYTDEVLKFRDWYCFRDDVVVEDCQTGARDRLSVRGAITRYNAEVIMSEESRFFFDEVMDYELDEYVFTLNADYTDDSEYDDNEYEYRDDDDDDENLLKENYIYDDY